MAVSANRLELLQIADAVAREKAIDRTIVITAMEDAIAKAARSRYGAETDVHAEINSKTGELRLSRHLLVVDAVENPSNQISVDEAQKRNPAAQVGDTIADALPPLEYGRIAAQSAKQVIVQKVREAERDRQYQEYKDRIGDIVNGIVKRVEYGNVVVDLGRGEAIVRRDEMLPRETLRNGDRVRAYIYDVRREPRGPQIFLSRTHPQFMAKLFAQEVPEIYDGIVEVKAVARDPGSRAKIAVISRDSSVDPVGACVGMRGSRVQAVVNELQGEKIDIIPVVAGHRDLRGQRARARRGRQGGARRGPRAHRGGGAGRAALARDRPARPERAARLAAHRLGHRHPHRAGGVGAPPGRVPEPHQDVHGGAQRRRGGRAVARLRGLQLGRGARAGRREGDRRHRRLRRGHRARAAEPRPRLSRQAEEAELDAKRKELGVEDAVKDVPGVTTAMLVKFGENGIKTVEDLAGCATDDLVGWTERKDGESKREPGILDGFELSREEAEAMIMQARLKAGWVTEADLAPPPPAEAAPAEEAATPA